MTIPRHTPAPEATRRARPGMRPHAVTLGLHDAAIIRLQGARKTALQIALALDCREGVVKNRLAVLYPEDGVRRVR